MDINSKENKVRERNLINTYKKVPQVGFVLGAGITKDSGVPMYAELALCVLEYVSEQGWLSISSDWVTNFVAQQREYIKSPDMHSVPPEEVMLFVRQNIQGNDKDFDNIVKDILYRDTPHEKIVFRAAFEQNPSLNALLSFCAARPSTVLAPHLDPGEIHESIESNIKVGGLLTTNYDNLIEGAFHTKYRRNLLKPVARPASSEADIQRRLIPVYHIHGYIRYRDTQKHNSGFRNPELVIAEHDYFEAFYHSMSFGNYVTMSFLRNFPCLFIGSQMTDKNLRRFLYHLERDIGGVPEHLSKFAILKTEGRLEEKLTDSVLQSYGVQTIWIDDFKRIPEILAKMYTAVKDVETDDWEYVLNYKWPKAEAEPIVQD